MCSRVREEGERWLIDYSPRDELTKTATDYVYHYSSRKCSHSKFYLTISRSTASVQKLKVITRSLIQHCGLSLLRAYSSPPYLLCLDSSHSLSPPFHFHTILVIKRTLIQHCVLCLSRTCSSLPYLLCWDSSQCSTFTFTSLSLSHYIFKNDFLEFPTST